MFDNVTQTQTIADQLKPLIQQSGAQPSERNYAMKVLQTFERCGWHDRAFESAVKQASPGKFSEADGRIRYDGPDVVSAAVSLLVYFIGEVCAEPVPSRSDQNVFSTAEAADYLGVSLRTMKKYIHETHTLAGQLVGKTLVFERDELDRFMARADERKPGRPAKKAQPT
jgi:excisionase family DNA binding protein